MPPPLDVPLCIITSVPETGEKGGEFEWDEFDATTTVNDAD